jgi:soluble lytic murein transglycosylase-like protein
MRRAAWIVIAGGIGFCLLAAPAKPAPGDAVPFQAALKEKNGARWVDRAAQAQAESGFDPAAQSWIINKQGKRVPCAFGLFQFTMPTWTIWGDAGDSPLQPIPAIKGNSRYMPYLEGKVKKDQDKAWAAYNAGLGSIQRAEKKAISLGMTGPDAWLRALPRVTGEANAAQTRGYLVHIKAYRANILKKVTP